MEYTDDANRNQHPSNDSLMLGIRIGRVGNRRTNTNDSNYIIIDISQNSEISPEDPRRLAIT